MWQLLIGIFIRFLPQDYLVSNKLSTLFSCQNKVWSEKKYTHIFIYYANLDCLGEKSSKLAKSTHTKDSKLVRQVHIVEKLPPGSMIYNKNYFWEITNFVNK